MSKYGIKYEIKFTNTDKRLDVSPTFDPDPQEIDIGIYDRSYLVEDDVDLIVHTLIPGGDPFHLISADNNEDKFTPIRAVQAKIQFLSDEAYTLATFTNSAPIGDDPGDPRWYVEIKIEDKFIFKGFLVLEDCSEAFMPTPNVVTLTAADGLAFLKNTPLVSAADLNPTGYQRIADFLSMCLNQTGLSLNLRVVFNIRGYKDGSPMGHLFDDHFLNAKTWEDKIGTCISCWDVLERILGEEAFLTQRCGEWWILRIDEIELNIEYNFATFLSDGSYDSLIEDSSAYGMFISKDGDTILFSDEATEVLQTSQHKLNKEVYKLEYWQEIVCNQDFDRGEIIGALPDETIDGVTYTAISYQVECWKYYKNAPPATLDADAYIKKLYDSNDYEKYRSVHFPLTPVSAFYYLAGEKFPMLKGDKLSIGVDFKWDATPSTPYTINILWIRLFGDDGSFWNFRFDSGEAATLQPEWVASDSTWATNQRFARFVSSESLTDWQSINFETFPLPVSGKIQIVLMNTAFSNTRTKDFANLSVEPIVLVNGSYHKYDSIYDRVSRPINFRTKRENQVYVSDAIHPLFKGGLHTVEATINYTDNTDFQIDGTILVPGDRTNIFETGYQFEVRNTASNNRIFTVVSSSWDSGINFTTIVVHEAIVPEDDQTAQFYDVNFVMANSFFNWKAAPTPTADQIHPYLHLQTFDVWNQCRNVMQVFRAQCLGLQSYVRDNYGEIDYPSSIHTYYLRDPHALTYNRRFLLLSFDQDWYKCEWKGTLVEVYNADKGKFYEGTDPEEVRYE